MSARLTKFSGLGYGLLKLVAFANAGKHHFVSARECTSPQTPLHGHSNTSPSPKVSKRFQILKFYFFLFFLSLCPPASAFISFLFRCIRWPFFFFSRASRYGDRLAWELNRIRHSRAKRQVGLSVIEVT